MITEVDLDVELATIPLTRGFVALVDPEDLERLQAFKWSAKKSHEDNTAYGINDEVGLMHRFILNAPREFDVDHIDGNGCNNQKSNLRLCTHRENLRNRGKNRNNTSGYKGVCWNKRLGKWHAQIVVDYKRVHLGYYTDLLKAAEAYQLAATELHGSFAKY